MYYFRLSLFLLFSFCSLELLGQNYTPSLPDSVHFFSELPTSNVKEYLHQPFNENDDALIILIWLDGKYNWLKKLENEKDYKLLENFDANFLFKIAIKNDNKKALTYLLDNQIVYESSNNWTPVHIAARDGKLKLLKLLVEHNFQINKAALTDLGETTPLMLAAYNNKLNEILYLIEGGADVNFENEEGKSAHSLAVAKGNKDIAAILEHHNDIITIKAILALYRGNEVENNEGIRPDIPIFGGKTIIHVAASKGNLSLLRSLDVPTDKWDISDNYGYTPLLFATNNNHFEVVDFLLKKGAAVSHKNDKGENAFAIASQNNLSTLKLFLEDQEVGREQFALEQELFKLSAKKELDLDEIKRYKELLEELEVNPNTLHHQYISPLFIACKSQNEKAIKLLLKNGVDVNQFLNHPNGDYYGDVAINVLAYNNSLDLAKLLMDAGADPTLHSKKGNNAIQIAEARKHAFMTIYLQDTTTYWDYKFNIAIEKYNLKGIYGALENGADPYNSLTKKENCFATLLKKSNIHGAYELAKYNYYPLAGDNVLIDCKNKDEHWLFEKLWVEKKDIKNDLVLYEAFIDNDTEEALAILKENSSIDVDNIYPIGINALQFSLLNNDNKMLAYLIERNVSLQNISDQKSDNSPLKLIASNDNLVAYVLLKQASEMMLPINDLAEKHKATHLLHYLKEGEEYYNKFIPYLNYWEAIKEGNLKYVIAETQALDIEKYNFGGYSPLHLAVKYNQPEIVSYLLSQGADINAQTKKEKETPLMLAAENSDITLSNKLINAGSDIDLKNNKGEKFTNYSNNNEEYVEFIIRYLNGELNSNYKSIFLDNCELGNLDRIQELYTDNPALLNSIDEDGKGALHYAVKYNNHNIVNWLLNKGIDPNTQTNEEKLTPLMCAVHAHDLNMWHSLWQVTDKKLINNDHFSIFDLIKISENQLLKWYIQHPSQSILDYQLLNASQKNEQEAIRLLNAGANPDIVIPGTNSWTPLHYAARDNHQQLINKLIEKKINLNREVIADDSTYWTPLMLAIHNDNYIICDQLLKAGASKDILSGGNSPIALAKKTENKPIELLLSGKQSQADKKYRLTSALVEAAYKNDVDKAQQLLELGVNPNQFYNGDLPLHIGSQKNNLSLVQLLLSYKVDINKTNKKGLTALDIAALNSQYDVLEILLAQPNIDKTSALQLEINDPIVIGALTGKESEIYKGKFQELLLDKAPLKEIQNLVKKYPKVINENLSGGFTGLHYAVRDDLQKVSQWLLSADVDINVQTDSGWTALHLAAINNRIEIGHDLLKAHANTQLKAKNDKTAREFAIQKGHLTFAKLIDAPDSIYYHEKLYEAINEYYVGDDKKKQPIYEALRNISDINYKDIYGFNALLWAAKTDDPVIVNKILSLGGDANKITVFNDLDFKAPPIIIPVSNNQLAVFLTLKQSMSPIVYEAYLDKIQAHAKKVNASWISFYLQSPKEALRQWELYQELKLAIDQEDRNHLQELILEGINLNLIFSNRTSPLIYAIRNHKNKVLNVLMNNGAYLNHDLEVYGGLYNPMQISVMNNNIQAFYLLDKHKVPKGNINSLIDSAKKYEIEPMVNILKSPDSLRVAYHLYQSILENDTLKVRTYLKQQPNLHTVIENYSLLKNLIKFLKSEEDLTLALKVHHQRTTIKNARYFSNKYKYSYNDSIGFMPYRLYHFLVPDQYSESVKFNNNWYHLYLSDPQKAETIAAGLSSVYQTLKQGNEIEAIHLLRKTPELLDYNFPDRSNWLHFAYQHNHQALLNFLIEMNKGYYTYSFASSPIAKMYNDGAITLVKKIINSGYDLNYQYEFGGNLLSSAIYKYDFDLIQYLFKNGQLYQETSYAKRTPLAYYFKKKLSKKSSPEELKMIQMLLEKGGSPNETNKSNTLLQLAVKLGNEEVVDLLLTTDANVNLKGETYYISNYEFTAYAPIHSASEQNNQSILQKLIAHGADINKVLTIEGVDYTPLMLAIKKKQYNNVMLLLEAGAKENFINQKGETAYNLATTPLVKKSLLSPQKTKAIYQFYEAIELKDSVRYFQLIDEGINLNVGNDDYQTPLHYAIVYHQDQLVSYISNLTDFPLDAKDINGKTALRYAIVINRYIELLLEKGADPNVFNNSGQSPLMYCIEKYKINAIQQLLDNNADPYLQNHMGENAIALAQKLGYKQIVDLLKSGKTIHDYVWADHLIAATNTSQQLPISTYNDCLSQIKKEFDPNTDKYIQLVAVYLNNSSAYTSMIFQYQVVTDLIAKAEVVYANDLEKLYKILSIYQSVLSLMGEQKKAKTVLERRVHLASKIYRYSDKLQYQKEMIILGSEYLYFEEMEKGNQMILDARKELLENYQLSSKFQISLSSKYAEILLYRKDTTAAIKEYEKCISLSDGKVSNSILGQLGDTYIELGEEEKGFYYFDQIIEKYDAKYLPLLPAFSFIKYAYYLGDRNQFEKADILAQRVKDILDNSKTGIARIHLYRQYLIYQNTKEDKSELVKGIYALNTHLNSTLTSDFIFLSEEEKANYLSNNRPLYHLIYKYCNENYKQHPELLDLMYNNTLNQKGMLLASVKSMFEGAESDNHHQQIQEYKEIKILLSKLYGTPPEKRGLDVAIVEKKQQQLEKELMSILQENGPKAKKELKDVLDNIQDDEVVIDIINFTSSEKEGAQYYAMTLTKGQQHPKLIHLCSEESLAKALNVNHGGMNLKTINQLYTARGLTSQQKNNYQDIYQLIVAPLEKEFNGKKKLKISPSGLTFKIAFAALPYKKDYLSDYFQISYVSNSAQSNIETPTVLNDMVLFGGIDYNLDSTSIYQSSSLSYATRSMRYGNENEYWSYLPGTKAEVVGIKNIFNQENITLHAGNEASEEVIKSWTTAPQFIHFATHGFYFTPEQSTERGKKQMALTQNENPLLRAGLILAGGNYAWRKGEPYKDMEDGILSAYELSLLDLSSTKLVVLSACETGLGDIQGSEGIYGLQRGLKMAGVDYIISSLWQVPDEQTKELMLHFYTYYQKGDSIPKAFEKAQKSLREKYPPFYWAAFVLTR